MQIGGGVHVGDALPSDCRFRTHSNMGTAMLCLKVSGRDLRLEGTTVQAGKAGIEAGSTRAQAGPANIRADGPNVATEPYAFRRAVLDDRQDLAVSDHGRTGRYHVLRRQRGVETCFHFRRFRFRPVLHPASDL